MPEQEHLSPETAEEISGLTRAHSVGHLAHKSFDFRDHKCCLSKREGGSKMSASALASMVFTGFGSLSDPRSKHGCWNELALQGLRWDETQMRQAERPTSVAYRCRAQVVSCLQLKVYWLDGDSAKMRS